MAECTTLAFARNRHNNNGNPETVNGAIRHADEADRLAGQQGGTKFYDQDDGFLQDPVATRNNGSVAVTQVLRLLLTIPGPLPENVIKGLESSSLTHRQEQAVLPVKGILLTSIYSSIRILVWNPRYVTLTTVTKEYV